jgi:hypothetical protein
VSLPELQPDSFTWQRWRAFDLFSEFGLACREYDLYRNRFILRRYAIGFLPAERLNCRPKSGEVAVMFWYKGEYQWCHLRRQEFERIFGGSWEPEGNMAEVAQSNHYLIPKPIKRIVHGKKY